MSLNNKDAHEYLTCDCMCTTVDFFKSDDWCSLNFLQTASIATPSLIERIKMAFKILFKKDYCFAEIIINDDKKMLDFLDRCRRHLTDD